MTTKRHFSEQKITRLITGAEKAGKVVHAVRLDGDAIEVVFTEKKDDEGTGLNLEWGSK